MIINELEYLEVVDENFSILGGLAWVAAANGTIPPKAVPGGKETNGDVLYICRAAYKGGVQPGKLVGKNCNFGYGGLEVMSPKYEVLTN